MACAMLTAARVITVCFAISSCCLLAVDAQKSMLPPGFRVPADWEVHESTLMAMPYRADLWGDSLSAVQGQLGQVAKTVAQFERVVMLCFPGTCDRVQKLVEHPNILTREERYDDVWIRDSGPVIATNVSSGIAIDFGFNAWGGQYPNFDQDNQLPAKLADYLQVGYLDRSTFVLEGSAVAADGQGTLIVTEECLLSTTRNPILNKAQIEETLKHMYNASAVIWLKYGLSGDTKTSGQVARVASFIEPGVVMLMMDSKNPSNAANSLANYEILSVATDAKGRKVEIVNMTVVPEILGGQVLFSYLDYYTPNGGVVMPLSGIERSDKQAMLVFNNAYPGRKVVGVPMVDIQLRGAGLKSITLPIPKFLGKLQAKITSCPPGHLLTDGSCTPCTSGSFTFATGMYAECRTCPAHAMCSGGPLITPDAGYWHSAANSTEMHKCKNEEACRYSDRQNKLAACQKDWYKAMASYSPPSTSCQLWGANASSPSSYVEQQCAPGFSGPLCGQCEAIGTQKRGMLGFFQCANCPSHMMIYIAGAVVIGGVALLVVVITQVYLYDNQRYQRGAVLPSDILQLAIGFIQKLSILALADVKWPWVMNMMRWFTSAVTGTIDLAMPTDCLSDDRSPNSTAIYRLVVELAIPAAILGVALLLQIIWMMVLPIPTPPPADDNQKQSNMESQPVELKSDQEEENSPTYIRVWAITITTTGLLTLPALVKAGFSLISCEAVDSNHGYYKNHQLSTWPHGYWIHATSTKCFTAWHSTLVLSLGVPCLAVVGGLLLLLLSALFVQHRKPDTNVCRWVLGHMTHGFKDARYYWHLLLYMEIISLLAIQMFAANISSLQKLALQGIVLLVLMLVAVLKRPYRFVVLQRIDLLSAGCLLLTVLVAMLFTPLDNESFIPVPAQRVAGICLLAVTLLFLLYLLWKLLGCFASETATCIGNCWCGSPLVDPMDGTDSQGSLLSGREEPASPLKQMVPAQHSPLSMAVPHTPPTVIPESAAQPLHPAPTGIMHIGEMDAVQARTTSAGFVYVTPRDRDMMLASPKRSGTSYRRPEPAITMPFTASIAPAHPAQAPPKAVLSPREGYATDASYSSLIDMASTSLDDVDVMLSSWRSPKKEAAAAAATAATAAAGTTAAAGAGARLTTAHPAQRPMYSHLDEALDTPPSAYSHATSAHPADLSAGGGTPKTSHKGVPLDPSETSSTRDLEDEMDAHDLDVRIAPDGTAARQPELETEIRNRASAGVVAQRGVVAQKKGGSGALGTRSKSPAALRQGSPLRPNRAGGASGGVRHATWRNSLSPVRSRGRSRTVVHGVDDGDDIGDQDLYTRDARRPLYSPQKAQLETPKVADSTVRKHHESILKKTARSAKSPIARIPAARSPAAGSSSNHPFSSRMLGSSNRPSSSSFVTAFGADDSTDSAMTPSNGSRYSNALHTFAHDHMSRREFEQKFAHRSQGAGGKDEEEESPNLLSRKKMVDSRIWSAIDKGATANISRAYGYNSESTGTVVSVYSNPLASSDEEDKIPQVIPTHHTRS